MDEKQAAQLRKPFPAGVIGKLPKGGVQLDFVGHAAVTDRLLAVDPNWSWEPMALDERGLPALDHKNNLWIRLTICGVTRIGVGDGNSAKECIGDAIRNAAMRFGVAIDLWSRDELEQTTVGADRLRANLASAPQDDQQRIEDNGSKPLPDPDAGFITPKQVTALSIAMTDIGLTDRDQCIDWIEKTVGRRVASRKDLTRNEAKTALDKALFQKRAAVGATSNAV